MSALKTKEIEWEIIYIEQKHKTIARIWNEYLNITLSYEGKLVAYY